MLPLTKLIRTIGGGFRREKKVQTKNGLSGLLKEFAIRLDNKIVNVKRIKCQSTSKDFKNYDIATECENKPFYDRPRSQSGRPRSTVEK